MHSKHIKRQKRARRGRMKMRDLGAHRLAVHRTPRHIYAQIIAPHGDRTLAVVSTDQKSVREQVAYGGNTDAAATVGKLIAAKALEVGVAEVAFDRSGFAYHGRVKALADAAREGGLKF